MLVLALVAAAATTVAAAGPASGGSHVADEVRWFSTDDVGSVDPVAMTFDAARGTLELIGAPDPSGSSLVVSVTPDQVGRGSREVPQDVIGGDAVTLIRGGRQVDTGSSVIDLTDLGIVEPLAAVLAPSSDSTDDPTRQNLFILDGGGREGDPRVVEASTSSASAAMESAAALDSTATLVKTTQTSAFPIPSPDTSGAAWIRHQGRLLLVDSEVEEMPWLWNVNQVNMYPTSYGGTLDTANVGRTQPWSNEPSGVGYNPATRAIFVSDDVLRRLNEVRAGSDGRYGTADDLISWWATVASNNDPEDVAYDTTSGDLWVIDGVDSEVYRYRAGADGTFGTADDPTPTQFDTYLGGLIRDPEGIVHYEANDTLLVLDSRSKRVYEFSKSGTLLGIIDIAAAASVKPAGITLAPPSNGGPGLNMYIVDRGIDNGIDPNENDGRLYEMSAGLVGGPPPANQAPVANAGPDQTLFGASSTTLDATGSTDDGGPAALSYSWSQLSGNAATIADPNAAVTQVTLPGNGSYRFQVTVTDAGSPPLSSTDEVDIAVSPGGQSTTVTSQVSAGADDAEENVPSPGVTAGTVSLTSNDLDLVIDNFGTTTQKSVVVGLRFPSVAIPKNATVLAASIQFRSDEISSGAAAAPSTLTIHGQAADNPTSFVNAKFNLSTRPRTVQSVDWNPPSWNAVNQVTAAQRSPDIGRVVQEIVDRAGWTNGNAMAFLITGTGSGTRVADSFEGGYGPVLEVTYTTGGPVANTPPVVSAGPDQAVTSTVPATVTLTGTVSDDGLPAGGTLVQEWSQVSGPATATIVSPTERVTSVSLPAAGPYAFRLTANDGELSSSSDVTVTVTLPTTGPVTLTTVVASGTDDAEQTVSNGNIQLASGDLDMPLDGNTHKLVGLRFTNVTVPKGAIIEAASIQLRSDDIGSAATTLTIGAQAVADAPGFTATKYDLSNRTLLSQTVQWIPAPWTVRNQAGPAQQTPSLVPLIEQLVSSSSNWVSGNAMVFVISGTTTGTRVADSFEGAYPPVLTIRYRMP